MITDTFTFKEDISVFEGNPDYTQMTIDQLYQLRSRDRVLSTTCYDNGTVC